MKANQETPNAEAVLVPDPECYSWKVLHCPHCGGTHWHGAGTPDADHDAYLGHRVAHCGRGGYVLIRQKSGAESARVLNYARAQVPAQTQ